MNLWAIIPLISFLTFTALFILVLQQARRRTDKVFALFLFASGVWSFTSFMLVFNPSSQNIIFWNGMVIVAIPWVAVCYYHFVRVYNNKSGGIGLYLGYAFVLAILVLCLNGYVDHHGAQDLIAAQCPEYFVFPKSLLFYPLQSDTWIRLYTQLSCLSAAR